VTLGDATSTRNRGNPDCRCRESGRGKTYDDRNRGAL